AQLFQAAAVFFGALGFAGGLGGDHRGHLTLQELDVLFQSAADAGADGGLRLGGQVGLGGLALGDALGGGLGFLLAALGFGGAAGFLFFGLAGLLFAGGRQQGRGFAQAQFVQQVVDDIFVFGQAELVGAGVTEVGEGVFVVGVEDEDLIVATAVAAAVDDEG